MGRGYRKIEELSTADLGFSLDELRGEGLEELSRRGAKLLLEVALAEEVTELLGRSRYERVGDDGGYRNGHRPRRIHTGAGPVEIEVPKVTGALLPHRSEVLPAWRRRSADMTEVLSLLYAEGLSTRDFKRALGGFWGESGLSRSSVSRANAALHEAFRQWRRRDLSAEEVLYLFLDGVYLKMRIGNSAAEAVLVAHGITAEGKRVLLGLILGGRESEDSWRSLLDSLESRGLKPPALVVHDGNPGLIKALKTTWPKVPRQRCIAHKIRNVLDRVPKKGQAEVKRALTRIFYAANLDEALERVKAFAATYGAAYPSACGVLGKDLSDCLTFYVFPQEHWRRLRTSNVIERAFREVRRRTDVVGRFPGEMSALVLIWATLEEDRLKWRGVRMDGELRLRVIAASRKASVEAKMIDVSALDRYLEAA
jgi:transposase-like protein